ncbi:SRPBCC family protein [Actinoplanes sp. TRM 88003]|uniref:SRPBCC family protein n=1 Tax=Paractinoplanes aksuensis TaxID=2939490 RepID=A0ABT1E108_9ACTN|nr:SRPBCC family protein [Actinoplanes aksuensis]MCO8276773.1 SRPBCC family protein [Actinoplanes aksuensis]
MEIGSIEREIYIEAAPEVVFEVVSDPKHVSRWWPDEADYEAVPGSTGQISFGGTKVEAFTVLEVQPPRTFTFRWTQPSGQPATADNSLLVTFELVPSGGGTLLKLTETGFRDEQMRHDHVNGWDFFLPRIAPYVATLTVRP